jgi:S-adenosylmethionine synthetase
MARHVAKNIVAAGLARHCTVQLAYAIGVAEPVSVMVDTHGTGRLESEELTRLARKSFPLTPKGIIDYLKLRRPFYRKTASYGHFGRLDPDFYWEKTNKAAELREKAGLSADPPAFEAIENGRKPTSATIRRA